jgi:hypothetical protein
MKYAEGQLNLTILGLGLGLTWLILTFALLKTEKLIFLFLQVILLVLVFFILGYRILSQKYLQSTDVLVWVAGSMILLYFLFYLKKLIQTKPDELPRQ